jgi:DNA polymerase/3'-5' exonuclease PolX
MRLEAARQLAQHLIDYMRPSCERIEVAGSIRRESEEVKDLEIVCIPRFEEKAKEFSLLAETYSANLLWEHLFRSEFIKWIKPSVPDIEDWHIRPDGKYWRGLILKGKFDAPADIKLDVFLTRPENWGVIYTIRTGSADFSRALVTYARDSTPYRVDGGELCRDTARDSRERFLPVPCSEERHLFDSLNLEWIEPRMRRGERDLEVKH